MVELEMNIQGLTDRERLRQMVRLRLDRALLGGLVADAMGW